MPFSDTAPRFESVDLQHLIDEAIALVRPDPVGVHVERALDGAYRRTDRRRERIRATVLNLLLNAARALNGAGRISVRTVVSGASAVIEIWDNGPGIPARGSIDLACPQGG